MRLEKLSNQLTLRLGGLRQLGWAPGKTEKEKKKRMLTLTHTLRTSYAVRQYTEKGL